MAEVTTSGAIADPTTGVDPTKAADTTKGADPAAGGDTSKGGDSTVSKPAAFFEGLYDKEGKIDKAAWERLPESLKQHKDLFAKYDGLEGLLGGFASSHKMAVGKAIEPLKGNATDAEKAERKAALDRANGTPKGPEGYGLAKPKELPDELWNPKLATDFATLAHKHSASPELVRDILALQVKAAIDEGAAFKEGQAQAVAAEDRKFAEAIKAQGVDAEKAQESVNRAASTLGIDLKDPALKFASVRSALLRVTNLLSEDKLVSGEASGLKGEPNYREQALDITTNEANPLQKAYWDPTHPRNEEARNRVTELYRLHGEQRRKRGDT